MTATTEVSHGKRRPRALRVGRVKPTSPAAALAAPFQDPVTKQFLPGNPGGKLKQAAALANVEAESLLRLPVDSVAPWLRGHLARAQGHVQKLVESLPAQTEELVGLCGDEAKARDTKGSAISVTRSAGSERAITRRIAVRTAASRETVIRRR